MPSAGAYMPVQMLMPPPSAPGYALSYSGIPMAWPMATAEYPPSGYHPAIHVQTAQPALSAPPPHQQYDRRPLSVRPVPSSDSLYLSQLPDAALHELLLSLQLRRDELLHCIARFGNARALLPAHLVDQVHEESHSHLAGFLVRLNISHEAPAVGPRACVAMQISHICGEAISLWSRPVEGGGAPPSSVTYLRFVSNRPFEPSEIEALVRELRSGGHAMCDFTEATARSLIAYKQTLLQSPRNRPAHMHDHVGATAAPLPHAGLMMAPAAAPPPTALMAHASWLPINGAG